MQPRKLVWLWVEAFNRADVDALAELYAADAVNHQMQERPIYGREAIRAILKWKFKPRVVDGIAVERRATQIIDFSLDDAEGF